MRDKLVYALAVIGAAVLLRNLYLIFMVVPDEAAQGMIYRLLYFRVPAWWTAFIGVGLSAIFSALYLARKNLRFDAIAGSATEVAVVFLTMGITLGSIWGRIIWGVWWAWDARLTSALICVLLYAGYLGMGLLTAALTLLRLDQEEMARKLRSLRQVEVVYGGR